MTIPQVLAFAQALRTKNAAWVQGLCDRLEHGSNSMIYQRMHTGSAFGDVAVQLHWGDVSRSLILPPRPLLSGAVRHRFCCICVREPHRIAHVVSCLLKYGFYIRRRNQ